ncbi:hypothetical protein PIB30_080746 [Stylosanthes scabra]|uniref:Uncharacterized protein n=1 Tax=Stylosanthes scabra TaxID=79078 RepID=A0ABU6SRN0_9FABA|nr:hypothetical protein [Stylosanthes scabra]
MPPSPICIPIHTTLSPSSWLSVPPSQTSRRASPPLLSSIIPSAQRHSGYRFPFTVTSAITSCLQQHPFVSHLRCPFVIRLRCRPCSDLRLPSKVWLLLLMVRSLSSPKYTRLPLCLSSCVLIQLSRVLSSVVVKG